MHENLLVFSIFLIFSGAAVLSTLALYTRQSLLVAYMLLGMLLGPWGLKWVADSDVIKQVGDVGIIFLLFLLGLHLQPQSLAHLLKKVTWVALASSIIFAAIGYGTGYFFNLEPVDCLVIGIACMFSSTIIGLKLLPTTVLHHQHIGELMIGVLLLQDLIAIIMLLTLNGMSAGSFSGWELTLTFLLLPLLLIFAFLFERFVLRLLFRRFSRIREYMFLLAIAWCLSMAELASMAGLSSEIGAFIAGVSIATSPISFYIAESLKPIRDFFLVLFFFSVGASFNLPIFPEVALPALLLAGILLVVKPIVFQILLKQVGEPKSIGWEIGLRLGQISEFSLLIVYVGLQEGLISSAVSNLIQVTTIATFVISSYLVVIRYPTPVALSDRLRRD